MAIPEVEKYFAGILAESYNLSYGIYRYPQIESSPVTSISVPDWANFLAAFATVQDTHQVIVSPELITATSDVNMNSGANAREIVDERINIMKALSQGLPRSTILLGTPVFNPFDKPTNSVLYIKNGEVTGRVNKRTPATPWEKEHFSFVPEETPALVPDTSIGVLICSDLATSTIYLRKNLRVDINEILRLSGKDSLIGKKPTFIDSSARSLVVPACWGVGSMFSRKEDIDPNQYFQWQLRSTGAGIFLNAPNIRHIVLSDRAVGGPHDSNSLIATKPINALLTSHIVQQEN